MIDRINQVLKNQSNAIVSFHKVKGREQQTDFNYVATAIIAS
jgi:hypothetical protein